MIHLTIDLIVLLAAILIGFTIFRKTNEPYLKLFPFFLLLVLLVEFSGELYQKSGQNNALVFNLFSVIEFSFFTYFFREVSTNIQITKKINLILYLLPACCLLNIFLFQGPSVFHTYTFSVGCLVMVGLGINYFYHLFKNKERVDLLREPAFWISIGIIFFFTCTVSVLGIVNYLSSFPSIIRSNIKKILLLVNTFFYILFIIAFVCNLNTRKSLSSS